MSVHSVAPVYTSEGITSIFTVVYYTDAVSVYTGTALQYVYNTLVTGCVTPEAIYTINNVKRRIILTPEHFYLEKKLDCVLATKLMKNHTQNFNLVLHHKTTLVILDHFHMAKHK